MYLAQKFVAAATAVAAASALAFDTPGRSTVRLHRRGDQIKLTLSLEAMEDASLGTARPGWLLPVDIGPSAEQSEKGFLLEVDTGADQTYVSTP